MDSMGQWLDYLAPSIYTLYDDEAGWYPYATNIITEAKSIADRGREGDPRPIICYLSPRYWGGPKAEQYMVKDMFLKQINFVLDHGCHALIWDMEKPWNPSVNGSQQAILDVIQQRYGVA